MPASVILQEAGQFIFWALLTELVFAVAAYLLRKHRGAWIPILLCGTLVAAGVAFNGPILGYFGISLSKELPNRLAEDAGTEWSVRIFRNKELQGSPVFEGSIRGAENGLHVEWPRVSELGDSHGPILRRVHNDHAAAGRNLLFCSRGRRRRTLVGRWRSRARRMVGLHPRRRISRTGRALIWTAHSHVPVLRRERKRILSRFLVSKPRTRVRHDWSSRRLRTQASVSASPRPCRESNRRNQFGSLRSGRTFVQDALSYQDIKGCSRPLTTGTGTISGHVWGHERSCPTLGLREDR
jgi:hypothetical protein